MAAVELTISESELRELLARRVKKATGVAVSPLYGMAVEVFRFGRWTHPRAPVRVRLTTSHNVYEQE